MVAIEMPGGVHVVRPGLARLLVKVGAARWLGDPAATRVPATRIRERWAAETAALSTRTRETR